MEHKLRNTLVTLVVGFVCAAQAAMAADDGQTQPKINYAISYSSSTPTDIIPTTNGSGNIKGVTCTMFGSAPIVKFYVNGGSAQSVTLGEYLPSSDQSGFVAGYTGWVPFNVRFTSSIRVTIQKASSAGGQSECAMSWGLD